MKKLIALAILVVLPLTGFAKDLTLLKKPQDKADVIAKVAAGDELIVIFTPKDSKWMKVADPRNGKVGWVKKAQLKSGDEHFARPRGRRRPKMYHKKFQRKIRDKKGHVIGKERTEYFSTQDPGKMSKDELELAVKRMRVHQMQMMSDMHRMMGKMFDRRRFGPRIRPYFDDDSDRPMPRSRRKHRPDRIIVPNGESATDKNIR